MPSHTELIAHEYFVANSGFTLVAFESDSKISRIEAETFNERGLIEIGVPAIIEVFGVVLW
jgi:hypothetical protein